MPFLARRAAVLSFFAAVLVARPDAARAQDDCEPPSSLRGPLEVTPAAGASGVTLGAAVRLRYSDEYFDGDLGDDLPEDIVELTDLTSGERVRGTLQVEGNDLFFVPAAAYSANRQYEGIARGIDVDLPFGFTTGTATDRLSPAPPEIVDVTSARAKRSCEAPRGGYRLAVSFTPSTDDGPPGDIEYLVYLSRSAGLAAPELRARRRNFPTETVTMAFVLDPPEAAESVCVSVTAVDGVGSVSDPQEAACFDPITGNRFQPLCAVTSPHPERGMGLPMACVALVGWTLLRRIRRRLTIRPRA